MKKIGWGFPPNNGGVADGANDGGRDSFAGARLSSFVRETIQNSIDARRGNAPVEVYFHLVEVAKESFSGFSEIKPHIQASQQMARDQHLHAVVEFYQQALDAIDTLKSIPILCIHDANTNGLTGPIDLPFGCWYALTKGVGLSQKGNAAALGSFGHGSNAPLTMSLTNQVFYLTNIDIDSITETRFQGKCRLQTHRDENDVLTQGTGFYGVNEGYTPLVNGSSLELAKWAINIRDAWKPNEVGSSIFVPYTDYVDEYYPETVITAIANFFYAIKEGNLVVKVNDVVLNSSNVVDKFKEYKPQLAHEQQEIDVNHIEKCFRSIDTVINSTNKGVLEIDNFGRVDWYLRTNDEMKSKTVGIARQTGMLITNKAPKLKRFDYCKPFDMFVCVKGKEGSDLLKSLENPQHNNFEFDRIRVPATKQAKRELYDKFVNEINELIKTHVGLKDTKEEDVVLDFMVTPGSKKADEQKGNNDRGDQLNLFEQPPKKTIYGKGKGTRTPSNAGGGGRGKNPAGSGTSTGDGKGTARKADGELVYEVKLENPRVVHDSHAKNKAMVYFDTPEKGSHEFFMKAIGEDVVRNVMFGVEKKDAVPVELIKDREMVSVEFSEPFRDYALECYLRITSRE